MVFDMGKLKYFGTECAFGRKCFEEILNNSKKISRATFSRRVDAVSLKSFENLLGYETDHKKGMTMKEDEYVEYYKSYFTSKIHNTERDTKIPVYFLVQSSNKYFFR